MENINIPKKLFLIILVSVSFILNSCKNEVTYECRIINNTNYRIDKIQFSCAVDEKTVSIQPKSTSERFTLSYDKGLGIFSSQHLLCLTVTEYSDSTKSYQNNIGRTISMNDLNKNIEFVVNYEQSKMYPSDIFLVTIK